MKCKSSSKNFNTNYVFIILISILLLTNIITLFKYYNDINNDSVVLSPETEIEEKQDNKTSYNKNKKYYTDIKYSKFSALFEGKDVSIIAIVDNTSYTYEKFKELINKSVFYEDKKIYLLEISKLSKKNEIAFYELDERFSKLESDFIIVVKESKILALIDFDSIYLNELLTNY